MTDPEEMANDVLAGVPDEIRDMPLHISPEAGLRTVALTMAVKYHGETVIKDGVMYQQLKLDQKEVKDLHPHVVLQTAIEFERYLRGDYAALADALCGGDFEKWLKQKVDEAITMDGGKVE